MPVEMNIWRIDGELQPVAFEGIDQEARLEEVLESHIEIVAPRLMVIGRQVRTAFDKCIDLLGMDVDGNLSVLELKRERTYRDIVSQVLDYGSWVRGLRDEDIARIYREYLQRWHPSRSKESINEGFSKRFGLKTMPEELNSNHELVIVATELDPSTERIVNYLAEQYSVEVNAVFLRFFKDGDRQYLSRAWLRDPAEVEVRAASGDRAEWNGEYYVTFGLEPWRDWAEARTYGFIAAGGGRSWSEPLLALQPESRVWVMVPGRGYVGVGEVTRERVAVENFLVTNDGGEEVPITTLPLNIAGAVKSVDSPERAEYLVGVKWLRSVALEDAIRERGFFANQNIVARPIASSWPLTVERLKERFGLT